VVIFGHAGRIKRPAFYFVSVYFVHATFVAESIYILLPMF
jgi:hypothetical protein